MGLLSFVQIVHLRAEFSVEDITNLSSEPSFEERHHALHRLSGDQLSDGYRWLFSFMKDENVPEGMRRVDYMSLVNDIFNVLLENDLKAQDLLELSIDTIPKMDADLVWRDYCVQKFGYLLGRSDLSPASVHRALSLLDNATSGAFPGLQGTALIVACKVIERHPEIESYFLDKGKIGMRAIKSAQSLEASLLDRVTALQVAARYRAEGTLAYSIKLIEESLSKELDTMLLVSAIAALGELGDLSHESLLKEHRFSPDVRLRSASRRALNEISTK
ncbi:MAG: hypothetical protein ACPGN3_02215 [Opitutales bacterium]